MLPLIKNVFRTTRRFPQLVALIAMPYALYSSEKIPQLPNNNLTKTGFIENKGQIYDQNHSVNTACLFLYPSDSVNLQLRKTGFSYDIYSISETQKNSPEGRTQPGRALITFHRVDVEFEGSNQNVKIEAHGNLNEYFNYYNSDSPITHVQSYSKVVYKNIYDNIDIEFLADIDGKIKYNVVIHPGGKINDIRLKFLSSDNFSTQLNNNTIELQTSLVKLIETIPESFIAYGSSISLAKVKYRRLEKNVYGFETQTAYPIGATLIIDPLTSRSWATYYGGAQHDGGIYGSRFVHDLTIDTTGAAYFTASTTSTSQIASSGAFQGTLSSGYDAFIVKLNCDGTRAWATYYGGSGSDYGHNLVIDNTFLYVVGTTDSPTGLATGGSYQAANGGGTEDLFLAKFDLTGTRIWATYYGGLGWEYGADIGLSNTGDVYISGGTNSSSDIATPGAHQTSFGGVWDAFIAKFSSSGTRIWATYYGGAVTEAWWSTKITTDNTGNVYLAADVWGANAQVATAGSHQPAYGGGSSDAFLAKFTPNGTRIWATFYGGTGNETYGTYEPFGMKTDAQQNIYFYGTTGSSNNIATPGAYQTALQGTEDVFLVKFNSSGTRIWGTYYGGTGSEYGYGLELDINNNIYITGITASASGIATGGAYDVSFNGGSTDGFFSKFSNTGTLLSGSYYGGSGMDRVNCIVTDGITQLYLLGETTSTADIATSNGFQPTFGGGSSDAFLVKFIDTDNIEIQGPDSVCLNTAYHFITATPDSLSATFNWIFPPGTSITSGQGSDSVNVIWGNNYGPVVIAVNFPGVCTSIYDTLEVVQYCPCNASLQLTVSKSDSCIIGNNATATVTAGTGASPYTYTWSPAPGAGQGTQTATGLAPGTYTVNVVDAAGCSDSATVTINAHVPVVLTVSSDTTICEGQSVNLTCTGAATYAWSPSTGLSSITGATVTGSPTTTTIYHVVGSDSDGCTAIDSITITVSPPVLLSVSPDTTICEAQSVTITCSGAMNYLWSPSTGLNTTAGATVISSPAATTTYYVTGTNSMGCSATDSITITISPPILLSVSQDTTICEGQSVNITCTGAVNYMWSPSSGLSSNSGTSVTATPATTTTYYVAGSNSNGCFASDSVRITVTNALSAFFAAQPVCFGDTTQFNNMSTGPGYFHSLWQLGYNGTSDTAGHPAHFYPQCNDYLVTLIISDNSGCADAYTDTVFVDCTPVSSFSVNPGCENQPTAFINNSTNAIFYSWDFNFNTGIDTSVPAPEFSYTQGNYTVLLVANSANGCSDSSTQNITIYAAPVASFVSDSVCLGDPIVFNGTSVNALDTIISWQWIFGDGTAPASTPTAMHTFSQPGTYPVGLIITNSHSCSDTTQAATTIYPSPNAGFNFENGCIGSLATFNSASAIGFGGTIQSYLWNFGDGNTSTNLTTATHTYLSAGNYPVTLFISSNNGCVDSLTKQFTVNPIPIANFSATTITGCSPLCVTFQDSSQIVTGNIVSALWTFGNESPVSASNYCFLNDSVPINYFDVSLTVTSDSGCSSTLVKPNYIVVTQQPVASFIATPHITTNTEPVISISNASTGGTNYFWQFGDSSTTFVLSPEAHTYSDTGTFIISLILSNSYGCNDTAYQTIVIEPDFTFYVPNSFTPNDDGVNDTFTGKGMFINKFEMMIFDRWGNMLYKTDDIDKPWDGKVNSGKELAQVDVYVYSIIVMDLKNKKHKYKGTVTVTR